MIYVYNIYFGGSGGPDGGSGVMGGRKKFVRRGRAGSQDDGRLGGGLMRLGLRDEYDPRVGST